MDVYRLMHRLWIGLLLGIFVLAAFGLWGDFTALQRSFTRFEWSYLPLIFCLPFLGYVLRFLKWELFLRTIEIRISLKNSFMIFLSGMSMAITPGKAGEILKSFLLKSSEKVDIARSAPVIFAERLTDLLAMILLAACGVTRFAQGIWLLVLTFLILIAAVLLMQDRRFCLGLLHNFKKYNAINGLIDRLEVLYVSSHKLLRFKVLLFTTLISTASWYLECLSFYFVLQGFDVDQSVLDALFIFSFSSIAGAVSMLPGGLGVTETSMTGLMLGLGIDQSKAIAATMMGRFATLWFGVIVGVTVILVNHKSWLHLEGVKQIK